MAKRLVFLIVPWVAAVVTLHCQGKQQAPPREFTNSVGMKFVRIDSGSFNMSWGYMGPIHKVTLSKGFYLQTTETTQAHWEAVMGNNPSRLTGPDRPVDNVSWTDAQEFLRRLNVKENGAKYRLPTEAEWEYACRAGQQEPESPQNLDQVAWWAGNSGGETHPVGRKRPNAWRLYDMRGNVSEWVQDWYADYSAGPQVDPQGPASGKLRGHRGGSWKEKYEMVFHCGFREFKPDFHMGDLTQNLGFRCARVF